MSLLHTNKFEEIPKGAVILTEEEALQHQWDFINQHPSLSKVWSLKYGAGILGALSGLTGLYINHLYRSRVRLGSLGAFSSYIPIVVLPTLASTVYHKVFVQSKIMLSKDKCPVCIQVRSAATQVVLGIAYPSLLAPAAAYMFAARHFTFRLPPISKPKELFAVYSKMTRPLSMFFSIAVAFHVLIGMGITHKEVVDLHRLDREMFTEEL